MTKLDPRILAWVCNVKHHQISDFTSSFIKHSSRSTWVKLDKYLTKFDNNFCVVTACCVDFLYYLDEGLENAQSIQSCNFWQAGMKGFRYAPCLKSRSVERIDETLIHLTEYVWASIPFPILPCFPVSTYILESPIFALSFEPSRLPSIFL